MYTKTGLYQLDNTFDAVKMAQHFFLKTNSENDWESVSANVSQQEQIHWTGSQNEKILPLLLSPFVCLFKLSSDVKNGSRGCVKNSTSI